MIFRVHAIHFPRSNQEHDLLLHPPNSRLKQRELQRHNSPPSHTHSSSTSTMLALQLLLAALPLATCLKFDIQAHPGHESASKERCIRNFVGRDQLVVVTVTASGSRGDGQTLNMHVSLESHLPLQSLNNPLTRFDNTDQRRSRQRLRPPTRHRRRIPPRFQRTRRQRIRCLLREHPHRETRCHVAFPKYRTGY